MKETDNQKERRKLKISGEWGGIGSTPLYADDHDRASRPLGDNAHSRRGQLIPMDTRRALSHHARLKRIGGVAVARPSQLEEISLTLCH